MEKKPTVSVVLCTYNGEKFLREQLDSILAQTYPIAEVIIQDDGSTDSTVAIARNYEARHDNVRVVENAQNLGFNLNFKSAAMKATGDLVAISDQDDVWFSDKIALQVAAIGEHDLCFTTHLRGSSPEHAHVVAPKYSLEALLFGGFAGHTMLLRRDFVQRDDSWMPCIYYDWSLAVKAWLGRGIVCVPQPMNWHRSHDDSAATQQHRQFFAKEAPPTWQPYVYGLRSYRELQRKPTWQRLYTTIHQGTSSTRFPLAHRMSGLMLQSGLLPLLRLCALCMAHRHDIYPGSGNGSGWMGAVRGFFLPFIFSYHNSVYNLDR